uniref:Enoyl-CoA hydratase/isomerase domain-containing protein n=1 Tax=Ananas comosus var. bracteatus TaxID=296719 RepID=A0A6V7Q0B4_ANACO|nr:unnamed protein product [Ananas comosus var. bracteatus]
MALAHSLSAPSSDPTPTSSSSAMDELIVVERRPHGSAVAVVTINRPGALNSLTRPMMVALAGAFRRLDADDTVAAVVLAGRGPRLLLRCRPHRRRGRLQGRHHGPRRRPRRPHGRVPQAHRRRHRRIHRHRRVRDRPRLRPARRGPQRQVRRPLRCRGRRSSPTLATPAPPLLANFNYPRPSLLADPCARGRRFFSDSSRCISRTASGSLIPHDEDDTAWIDAEFKAGAEQKEATENTLAAYKADQDMVLTELTPTRHARQLFDEMPRIWL